MALLLVTLCLSSLGDWLGVNRAKLRIRKWKVVIDGNS